MLTGEDANSVGPFGTAARASEGVRAAGRPLDGMDQSAGRSVTAIRPEELSHQTADKSSPRGVSVSVPE